MGTNPPVAHPGCAPLLGSVLASPPAPIQLGKLTADLGKKASRARNTGGAEGPPGHAGDVQRMGLGVRQPWVHLWNLPLFISGTLGTGLYLSKPQLSDLYNGNYSTLLERAIARIKLNERKY